MPDIPQDQWEKIQLAARLGDLNQPPRQFRTTADRLLANTQWMQRRIKELEEQVRRMAPYVGPVFGQTGDSQ